MRVRVRVISCLHSSLCPTIHSSLCPCCADLGYIGYDNRRQLRAAVSKEAALLSAKSHLRAFTGTLYNVTDKLRTVLERGALAGLRPTDANIEDSQLPAALAVAFKTEVDQLTATQTVATEALVFIASGDLRRQSLVDNKTDYNSSIKRLDALLKIMRGKVPHAEEQADSGGGEEEEEEEEATGRRRGGGGGEQADSEPLGDNGGGEDEEGGRWSVSPAASEEGAGSDGFYSRSSGSVVVPGGGGDEGEDSSSSSSSSSTSSSDSDSSSNSSSSSSQSSSASGRSSQTELRRYSSASGSSSS